MDPARCMAVVMEADGYFRCARTLLRQALGDAERRQVEEQRFRLRGQLADLERGMRAHCLRGDVTEEERGRLRPAVEACRGVLAREERREGHA